MSGWEYYRNFGGFVILCSVGSHLCYSRLNVAGIWLLGRKPVFVVTGRARVNVFQNYCTHTSTHPLP